VPARALAGARSQLSCTLRALTPGREIPANGAFLPSSNRYSFTIPQARPQLFTRHGHDLDVAVSALQKAIRRSHLDDALYWASELFEAGYDAYLWRRLRVILSEDVGVAEPGLPAVIEALHRTWGDMRKEKGRNEILPTMHAVILMARAKKSRLVENALVVHTQGDRQDLYREPPDHALDQHTQAGRALGRSMTHFYEEGALLADPETGELSAEGSIPDPYRERARALEDR